MFFKNHLAKTLEPLLEHLENKLEQEGQWQKAQELRYQQYEWRRYHPKLKKQTSNYLARVYNHRLQIQREAYLQVEHDNLFQQLEKDPSLADNLVTEIECFQKRLKDVDRDIWMAERDVESAIRAFPEGPFKRALCARRQKNNSYLAKHLQIVCAAVGGCCGRGCGCCTRPRNSKRPNHFAHCTSMCRCCENARGFKINSPNTRGDPMAISITIKKADLRGGKRSFAKEVINAHIWRL
ncbi:hypothetical protein BDV33DRAFT_189679 [Aspergillus novoparasiticus]|uniref:Uncharacterized protein n=1 Tax=Aspergillus novoparasiticus TaxID=986946 RepID=A0A5N6F107_9EURO|nr:hypothetical protein BDV33DRAFT_189679 [Aspergillus novoparasiticus]